VAASPEPAGLISGRPHLGGSAVSGFAVPVRGHGAGEVNFADRGLQLSRGFRALKIWKSVHTFGLAAFRAAIQRNLQLAEFAQALVRSRADGTPNASSSVSRSAADGWRWS
jgi:glutamate/tyrosine decarboxylase-like PLP-dependent enzyme